MKKVLKILSLLLIVPVLGIGSLLAGCGKKSATLNDIIKEYNAMVSEYGKELFNYNEDKVTKDNDTITNYFGTGDNNTELTFQVNLGTLTNHGIDSEENLQNLKTQYTQLESVFGKLLTYSNTYFKTYQTGADGLLSNNEADPSGEELYNLLQKLKNLRSAVDNFYSNLQDRIALAEFLGHKTQAMASKLNTFNSVYVDLIDANFEFNIEFAKIHEKYILKNNVSVEDFSGVSTRVAQEAALKYAYGYFISNIKVFKNNNLCNISNLQTGADSALKVVEDVFTTLNSAIKDDAEGSDTANLIQMITRFDTFLQLYKENAADLDLYSYMLTKVGRAEETLYENTTAFEKSLSAVDKAKLDVVNNFTSYDMDLLNKTYLELFK